MLPLLCVLLLASTFSSAADPGFVGTRDGDLHVVAPAGSNVKITTSGGGAVFVNGEEVVTASQLQNATMAGWCDCYEDLDINGGFDQAGTGSCTKPGFFVQGLRRSQVSPDCQAGPNVASIHCIEGLRCCRPCFSTIATNSTAVSRAELDAVLARLAAVEEAATAVQCALPGPFQVVANHGEQVKCETPGWMSYGPSGTQYAYHPYTSPGAPHGCDALAFWDAFAGTDSSNYRCSCAGCPVGFFPRGSGVNYISENGNPFRLPDCPCVRIASSN